MCVNTPLSHKMNNKYICDLQIVDIYQNIRPPPRPRSGSKPLKTRQDSTRPYAPWVGVVEERSVLMGLLRVLIYPLDDIKQLLFTL